MLHKPGQVPLCGAIYLFVKIWSPAQENTGKAKSLSGPGIKIEAVDVFFDFADMMSPLGNASAEDCANYIAVMFSDYTRMVTMQNLMHDGGFSSSGITNNLIERLTK